MDRQYPNIYLAADNCFAKKRWPAPREWAGVIADLGVRYVEASADTELDPFYMGEAYLRDWPQAVQEAQAATGVRVCNLYSGHGSYTTLGLTHFDPRVRRHMIDRWFKPLVETAATLGAGFGFYAHAFSESILAGPDRYAAHCGYLLDALTELNEYAEQLGCGPLCLEQMYSPNQVPWTISGTASLLREVTRRSGRPFYFTEDLGHHHDRFLMPSREALREAFRDPETDIWLGSQEAYDRFDAARVAGELSDAACDEILDLMRQAPRYFESREDTDCYAWLRALGCYSPIIHLQQTEGRSSAHCPFTPEQNRRGKIRGRAVLEALKESYDRPAQAGMPPRCEKIYLTFELFAGTSQTTRSILKEYAQSVRYWRQFIPQDGLPLDELLRRLPEEETELEEQPVLHFQPVSTAQGL